MALKYPKIYIYYTLSLFFWQLLFDKLEFIQEIDFSKYCSSLLSFACDCGEVASIVLPSNFCRNSFSPYFMLARPCDTTSVAMSQILIFLCILHNYLYFVLLFFWEVLTWKKILKVANGN